MKSGVSQLAVNVGLMVGVMLLISAPAQVMAWSWKDLWRTPHEQRQALEQSGNFQALIEDKKERWQGVGHYRNGDYAAAAQSYAASVEKSAAESDTVRDLYNQATALTQAGKYDDAIKLFGNVLQQDPSHQQAEQNLAIAQQLKNLQQQNPQQPENGEQGDDEDSQGQEQQQNQQQPQDQDQQQDQQQSEEQDQQNKDENSSQQNSAEQNAANENQQERSPSSDSQPQQETPQEEQQSATEQQQMPQQETEQQADAEPSPARLQENEQAMTENEQAIEQWLRQIPDDPSGLLRRKLIRNHRIEYPEVGASQSPW